MIGVQSTASPIAPLCVLVIASQGLIGSLAYAVGSTSEYAPVSFGTAPTAVGNGAPEAKKDTTKPTVGQPPTNIAPPAPAVMPNAMQPAALQALGPPAASTPQANAQKSLTVDLALPGTYAREAGTYTLKFVNKVPTANYTVSSKVISKELPAAFDLSAFTLNPKPEPGAKGIDPKCQAAVNKLRDTLAQMRCESDISALRATYKVQLQQLSQGTCSDSDITAASEVVTGLTEWTDSDPLPALANGDSVTVTVNRTGTQCASDDPRTIKSTGLTGVTSGTLGTWTYNIGKVEAQWLVYYGFNFAPSGDQEYFSKANPGTNPPTYTITRKASTHGSSFSPSVYVLRLPGEDGFSWSRLAGWRSGDYMGGLTAGLGFDFDNPTVFLGYGIGWGYNVMLTAGVVMHKEDRLNGQYAAGQIISENLTPSQLVESTYKPQAYVGLAFRFGSNPFKSTSTGNSNQSSTTGGGNRKSTGSGM